MEPDSAVPGGFKAVLALEVYGEDDMHAVEVTIDPDDDAPFSFATVWNPQLANK